MTQFQGLFNGHLVSYNAAIVRIGRKRFYGLPEWSLSDELTTSPEFGSSPFPIGAPIGQWKGDGSCKQHLTEADALAKYLNQTAGDAGFGMAFANIFLDFTAPNVPRTKIQIEDVRFIKRAVGLTSDGKAVVTDWGLLIQKPIKWNDVYILNPAKFGVGDGVQVDLGGAVVSVG